MTKLETKVAHMMVTRRRSLSFLEEDFLFFFMLEPFVAVVNPPVLLLTCVFRIWVAESRRTISE